MRTATVGWGTHALTAVTGATETRLGRMPRPLRIIVPGLLYHVTHRGNDGQDIFRTVDDRRSYLRSLRYYADLFGIRFVAYALMTNHIHFVVITKDETGLSKFISRLHSEHAQRMNAKYGLTGHLFGERFFANPFDPDVAETAVRYVELNPVRAGIVARAEQYEFSSARANALRLPDGVVLETWEPLRRIEDYTTWLHEPLADAALSAIRAASRRGRRVGRDDLEGVSPRALSHGG